MRTSLFAVTLALISVACSGEYDRSFDTEVAMPAYTGEGPVVLYDQGHLNVHAADGAYRPFVELLRNDGYGVRVGREELSAVALDGVGMLVIALARGANDSNDAAAFAVAECDLVERWVRDGGSLLLVTDHWPYGSAVATLAQRFDVHMGAGLVEDPEHHHPTFGASHLVFSVENGLLHDHPIVQGRSSAERVQQVLTFTGQSIQGPPNAVPFLALAPTAVEYPPTAPTVDKRGGDVVVHMDYGDARPAPGNAQAIAFEHGRGRVVVLGEAGMLRAQSGKRPVGMTVEPQNRQLALNIAHWLTRLI